MDSIRIKKESIFSNRIASERPHIFIDEFRQDSLVTKSLLHTTSYDLTGRLFFFCYEKSNGLHLPILNSLTYQVTYQEISVANFLVLI